MHGNMTIKSAYWRLVLSVL